MKIFDLKLSDRWYLSSVLCDKRSTVAELRVESSILTKLTIDNFELDDKGFPKLSDMQKVDGSILPVYFEDAEYEHLKRHYCEYKHVGALRVFAISAASAMGFY